MSCTVWTFIKTQNYSIGPIKIKWRTKQNFREFPREFFLKHNSWEFPGIPEREFPGGLAPLNGPIDSGFQTDQ